MAGKAAGRATALSKAADPLDPSFHMAQSPFYWLVRVVHRYSHDMDAILKRIGMDVPRWRVLMILTEFEPASVSQLADHGVIRLSTMTKTVQRLEADGLVKTAPRPTDARVTEVVLTPGGRDAVARVRAQASRVYHQAFEGVDNADMTAMIDLLRHVFDNLESVPR